jgi:EAL domain-containing protein (putative c-di-GMP-specific phosphodiesterase class I)
VEALLARADTAMYVAKEDRRGVRVYSPEIDRNSAGRLQLVAEIKGALQTDSIVCHFQPLATVPDAVVRGMEALVRWEHPERGLMLPDDFLPLVEHAGLMPALTSRVLDLALAQCRRWRDGGRDLTVGVNLSPRSLRDDDLPVRVAARLEHFGVPASSLELEITESSLLDDPEQSEAVLNQLSGLGVRIVLDDFGTGYSSLAYLAQLPVDKIKIDRTFVAGMAFGTVNKKIVKAVIDLGHRLGVGVVAEGVESMAVWEHLGTLGCGLAQGLYLSPPLPPEAIEPWLATRRSRPLNPLERAVTHAGSSPGL